MLLTAGKLRVALATTHLPLRQVPDAISASGLQTVLRILHAELVDKFAVAAPRIVVCGLNPHDDGLAERQALEILEVFGEMPRQCTVPANHSVGCDRSHEANTHVVYTATLAAMCG